MGLLKLFIDIVYKGLITFGVIAVLFLSEVTLADVVAKYDNIKQQEEQLQELYDQQVYVLQLIKEYQKFNLDYIDAIVEKPTYDYLSSVTTYMFKPAVTIDVDRAEENGLAIIYEGDTIKGSVGTGTIIAQRNGYSYILTNKHVCDTGDECNIIFPETNQFVPLDFVKRIESKYDLALWRTRDFLPGKQAINGFSIAYPQNNVFSVGHYLGNPYIYTEGTFGGYQNDYVLFNMSCAPGCSGSGVFDKYGYLIGVVFAGNRIGMFQMDTAKIMGINGDVIQLFLKEFIDE